MAEPWPLALMLLLCGSPLYRAEPLYILVTPRVLRLGSPENIHVQAHSESRERLQGSLEVNLTVWDFPLRKTLLASSRVVLSATNDFMEQTPVTVPESLLFPRHEKPGQHYVIIRADWKPTSVSSFMEKIVLVAPHAGYIFIQTDKTIYTPDHMVQYRVFAVNHKMDPVNRAILLDIKNPDGVTVISHSRQVINGLFDSSFHLPELVSLGTWTIEASYQSAGKQKFKATFDVKEYVLPSFEVQLTPNKTFFTLNDEALGVDIQARYIFNKPVDGHALAIFGLKVDNIRTTIQGSLQRVEVSEGQGHVSLQKDTLLAAFQDPEGDFSGASIFVNVTVFSSGGEMVQAETSGVKITRKAFNIKFTKTPQYFKPGMPFHFRVFVSNPDGSPAARVLVRCQNHKVYTSDNGIAALAINTDAASSELTVLVETESPHPEQQVSARMTAWPYSTQENSGNFLHVEVNTMGMDVGNSLQLSLNTRHANPATKDEITHFTIMVLSKGRVVSARQQLKSSGSVYTSAIIDVTPEMLPSFRIVAFYLLPRGMSQNPELVADSIWIDVNDRCMGTLKVGLKRDGVIQPLEPQSQVELKVTGDAEARVWLLAVDKAVYALNSKHKLTQKKVWDVVEEHDIGCTAGSGKNNFAVFKDAGLDLKISTGMDTLASSDWRCPQSPPPNRRRRSLRRLEAKRDAVNKFKTELERKCCEAGLKENPAGLACEERTRHVLHGPSCMAAFLDCCQLSETLTREAREERLLLGTTDDDDEFLDDIFLDDLPVRTLFPESWLWRSVTLPESASGTSHLLTLVSMPDSITTWEFVAVSLKAGRGLCLSDPFELTVMKSFFVDLKLPSSVVRNEQIQIQAVLYNFRSRQVKVRVEFPYKEPLCSASKPGAPSRQVVTVPPTSSKIVPFVLLPLELGEVEVEVKAVGPEARDHVKKTLLVRAGGQVQRLSHSFLLNPQGRTQTELVPRRELLNKVPDTEAEVFVSVQGDILGETIVGSLTPKETRKLLTVPTGCPEQTLSKLAPVIILTKYLDSTGQWSKVGVEHREQVLKNLVIGHTQMLRYRSADGIYRLTQNSPGSTWFTSYMFRIFALAYPIMTDKLPRLSELCAMAKWVITQRQAEDGHFLENGPVVMKSMQGGYKGSEADISLTALVLIALHSGQELCSPTMQNLDASIKRASNFLETKLPTIQTTFAIAIVSYALALANSPKANDRLDSFANYSHCGDCGEGAADKTYWPVGEPDEDSLYTIEATAYALMQKLQLGRFNETHAIANWLLEKRELGGGFKSTQTTVVAIEALTSFRKNVPFEGEQNLDVQISVPKRAVHVNWLINHNNAYQQRSAKFFSQDDLVITASGHGTGTISILTTYYKSPESWESPCTRYHLNVTLHSTPEANKKGEETFRLRMETRYLGAQDATMTIMEVSLLTGFYPNQEDLKQLTNNVEPYAFQYETKTSSSDSSVVLYLEKLSHQENTVLGFRIHQMLQADFLQAAMVTVYDYYEPSHRCSAFYNLPTERSSLRKICHKDVCRCAEGQCAALRTDSSRLSKEELQEAVCEAGVDFVYKIKLEGVEASATTPYVYYNMRLQAVIKSGTDPVIPNTLKKFVSHATCHDSLDLQEQESYLVMGQTSDLWKVKSDYTYVLGKDTFLMLWPADGDVRRRKLLDELEEFSEYLTTHGCQS